MSSSGRGVPPAGVPVLTGVSGTDLTSTGLGNVGADKLDIGARADARAGAGAASCLFNGAVTATSGLLGAATAAAGSLGG